MANNNESTKEKTRSREYTFNNFSDVTHKKDFTINNIDSTKSNVGTIINSEVRNSIENNNNTNHENNTINLNDLSNSSITNTDITSLRNEFTLKFDNFEEKLNGKLDQLQKQIDEIKSNNNNMEKTILKKMDEKLNEFLKQMENLVNSK